MIPVWFNPLRMFFQFVEISMISFRNVLETKTKTEILSAWIEQDKEAVNLIKSFLLYDELARKRVLDDAAVLSKLIYNYCLQSPDCPVSIEECNVPGKSYQEHTYFINWIGISRTWIENLEQEREKQNENKDSVRPSS